MAPSENGFGAVLRNPYFLLLWLAQATSQIAQNGVNLVQIVLIETLTHSSGQIALMVLAFSLPGALLSLVAGVVVDRVSNRLILIASNILRVVFTLGYFAALHAMEGWPALVTIYLLTASNELLRPNLERDLKPGARVVSHDFEIRGWKPSSELKVDAEGRSRTIYVYEIGARK